MSQNDNNDSAFSSFVNGDMRWGQDQEHEVSCPAIHPRIKKTILAISTDNEVAVEDWERQIAACLTVSAVELYGSTLTEVEQDNNDAFPTEWITPVKEDEGPEYLITQEELRTMIHSVIQMAFMCRRSMAEDYE